MEPSSTPNLDNLARWLARQGRLAAWHARKVLVVLVNLAAANERETMLYLGLLGVGIGLGLEFGAWLGILVPSAVLAAVAVFGVAPVAPAPPATNGK